ncbi:hypothetical protein XENOCAPTIV_009001 [Xenoophorus captivus]|uniref:Uncharacterized protein n=1 Tax=Xenoophorus captivus TaxID=1517983 RepID=A0ABV0RJA5_9TELE
MVAVCLLCYQLRLQTHPKACLRPPPLKLNRENVLNTKVIVLHKHQSPKLWEVSTEICLSGLYKSCCSRRSASMINTVEMNIYIGLQKHSEVVNLSHFVALKLKTFMYFNKILCDKPT